MSHHDEGKPFVAKVPIRHLTVATLRKMKRQLEANTVPYRTYIMNSTYTADVNLTEAGAVVASNDGVSPPEKNHLTCAHLQQPLNRKKADVLISRCVTALSNAALDFDTFAFSGNSGALIAPTLAYLLGKELIMVRNPAVKCVSGHFVEGFQQAQKYVLVDDLVCGGATAARIVRGVFNFAPQAKLAGFLLYTHCNLLTLPGSMDFNSLMLQMEDIPAQF